MKRLLMLSFVLATATTFAADKHEECNADDTVTAQASALLKVAEKLEEGECPAPKAADYKALCVDVGTKAKTPASEAQFYEYNYERRIWQISCASPLKDSEEQAKEKIGRMWSKYQKQFKCDSMTWNLPNGNILKFSIAHNKPDVIETFASSYGMDINFVDPVDNKNLLDFVDSEIARFGSMPNGQASIKIYTEYRSTLIDMGAKPSKP